MRRIALLLALFPIGVAVARHHDDEFFPPPALQLEGAGIGGARPAGATPAYLTASRIAAIAEGALAIDADTGLLFATDAAGALRASLAIGRDAGLLAVDPTAQRVYVADRRGDRIVVVSLADRLVQHAQWKTPAEPYAVALTPDRALVLVATIADRALVAYDAVTQVERWRVALASEPRGLAVSPDGKHALVTYLATSYADQIELADERAMTRVPLPAPASEQARGAFAGTFLGAHLAVVAFQRERPSPTGDLDEVSGHYGGSPLPPISHHLAFLGEHGAQVSAVTQIHEPRALAWDAQRDLLYLAGLGDDAVVIVGHASQLDPAGSVVATVGGKERCGVDGLAVRGDDVLVWCSFTRSVATIARAGSGSPKVARGPALAPSTLDEARHLGLVTFHTADANISAFGAVACGNCHLDGRADGMSWRIAGRDLQTPMLAGRLVGTAPFKWDGTAKDLPTSLGQTLVRLGGSGLGKAHLRGLAAYLEGMPPVRVPTRDPQRVAHGQALFESGALGCATCHDGNALTDRQVHAFGKGPGSDTPSLIGLAASAPYFHDGSAATLEALLRERATVHGMAEATRRLDAGELGDLIAYLETR